MIAYLDYFARFPGTKTPPDHLVQDAEKLSVEISSVADAQAALSRLMPQVQQYRPDDRLLVACGMLLEKLRLTEGMLDVWSNLQLQFPDNIVALRMLMRWYRRSRQVDEGVQRLSQLISLPISSVDQAEKALVGYTELRTFDLIDVMILPVLATFPDARALRIRYIQCLVAQERFVEAAAVAREIQGRDKLGASSAQLLEQVECAVRSMQNAQIVDSVGAIARAVDCFQGRVLRPPMPGGLGPVVFFTGQLGAGGAERQMTRLAAAMKARFNAGEMIAGQRLLVAPRVCVRHVTASSGADFFLPVLREAGVETTILTDVRLPTLDDVEGLTDRLRDLLLMLPEDLQHNTLKLVPYFRQTRADVAYLWQDGGVLAAALAALIAGVPRIITSFRGLPPNLRPELMRPQMPHLLRALIKVPGVSFSANSASVALAYEDWLGLAPGTVGVMPNAVPPVLPEGDADDEAIWQGVLDRSADCTRTVLGIFRFDQNKRPEFWVQNAAAYVRRHRDTRFAILGRGHHFQRCQDLIADLGVQDRVFLCGATRHVGFYLHKADLVMHLARMEGLPNVLIEAHLAGVAVLATPAGGTAEVVEHGATGHILSQSDDPDAAEIQSALEQMLQDPARLGEMGQVALSQAKQRFLLDQILGRTVTLFLERT